MSDSRKEFEEWCVKDDEFCIHRYDGDNDYSDDYTQSAWLAWQGRQKKIDAVLEYINKQERTDEYMTPIVDTDGLMELLK